MDKEHRKTSVADDLGDRLAAGHLLADRICGENANATSIKTLKFKKGTSDYIKKLVRYYKFERFKRVSPRAFLDIKNAYSLYTGYTDRSSMRWMLEALILGGLTNKAIENIIGVGHATISCYKKYYFDLSRGNKQMLITRSSMIRTTYKTSDISNWGYKAGIIANGADWFIRVYLDKKPTKEDEVLLDKGTEISVNIARHDVSLMIGNIENYDNPNFTEMVRNVGATYDHLQKDATHDVKLIGVTGGGSNEVSDMLLEEIANTFIKNKKDVNDTRESAFGKDKQAVEELPL